LEARFTATAPPRERPKSTIFLSRVNVLAGPQVGQSGLGIQVGAFLGHVSVAAPLAAVVEKEDAHAKAVSEQFEILQAMAYVARVSMKPQPSHLALTRNKPDVEPDSIGNCKIDVLEVQAPVVRRLSHRLLREENEISLYHPVVASHQKECDLAQKK
jgi:hypothetical protein